MSWKSDSTRIRSEAQAAMSSLCAGERALMAVDRERNAFGWRFCKGHDGGEMWVRSRPDRGVLHPEN